MAVFWGNDGCLIRRGVKLLKRVSNFCLPVKISLWFPYRLGLIYGGVFFDESEVNRNIYGYFCT